MRGHEYIRDALLGYLAVSVPPRLAAHLSDIGQTQPVLVPGIRTAANPLGSFLLADSLQDITEGFPVVAVRSSDAPDSQRMGSDVWSVFYDLEVMVACDHRSYGDLGYDQASRARDRLLLAVRESLWRVTGLTSAAADGSVEFPPSKRPERTGKGNMQTLSGVAIAAGTVSLRARVEEALTDLDPPESVAFVDLSVSGLAADQNLPT